MMLHPDIERAIVGLAGREAEVPYMPRAARLGVDYALRVAGPTGDLAVFARHCFAEGVRRNRDDAPGDPPPDCEARAKAERAGPLHARAFSTLERLRDSSELLRRTGESVLALPRSAEKLIQTAARGERVDTLRLELALEQADRLIRRLSHQLLRRL
jgi:hypothetical protein